MEEVSFSPRKQASQLGGELDTNHTEIALGQSKAITKGEVDMMNKTQPGAGFLPAVGGHMFDAETAQITKGMDITHGS